MKRRIAYAGAALAAAVFATMALTAPSASADTDWNISDPGTSQGGPSADDFDWG